MEIQHTTKIHNDAFKATQGDALPTRGGAPQLTVKPGDGIVRRRNTMDGWTEYSFYSVTAIAKVGEYQTATLRSLGVVFGNPTSRVVDGHYSNGKDSEFQVLEDAFGRAPSVSKPDHWDDFRLWSNASVPPLSGHPALPVTGILLGELPRPTELALQAGMRRGHNHDVAGAP